MATIANLVVEVSAKASGLRRGLASARRRATAFAKSTAATFSKLGLGLSAAFTVATALIINSINKTANQIDELAKSAGALGIVVGELQALNFAAGLAGLSASEMAKVMQKLQKSIFDAEKGLSTAKDAFAALGLNVKELKKLNPEDQFLAVADALAKVKDQSTLTGVSMDLLGRGGAKAINLVKGDIRGLVKEFKEYDLALTKSQATAVETFNDAKARFAAFGQGFREQVTANVAPAFTAIILHVKNTIKEMGGIRKIAESAAKGLIDLGIKGIEGIIAVGKAFTFAGTVGLRFENTLRGLVIELTKFKLAALDTANLLGFVLGGEFGTVLTKSVIKAESDLALLEKQASNTAKQIQTMMDAADDSSAVENLTTLKNSLGDISSGIGASTGTFGASSEAVFKGSTPVTSSRTITSDQVSGFLRQQRGSGSVVVNNNFNDNALRDFVNTTVDRQTENNRRQDRR